MNPRFVQRLVPWSISCAFVALSATAGKAQQAVRFNGDGSFLEITHDSSLTTSRFSIEFWLKIRGLGDPTQAGGEQTVLDKRGGDTGYNVRLAGTSFPLSVFSLHGAWTGVGSYGTIEPFTWIHVAATQSADSAHLYLNGELQNVVAGAYTDSSRSALHIGDLVWAPQGSLPLNGDLDELRIWDYVRPADSLRAYRNIPLRGDEPGLKLYLDFETVDGDTIRDRSPFGNDAVRFGTPELVPSDAPIGFDPLPPPHGLRAWGLDEEIRLNWVSTGGHAASYAVYRSDSLVAPADQSTWLATVPATDSTYADLQTEDDHTYFYRLRSIDSAGNPGPTGRPAAARRVRTDSDFLTGVYYEPRYGPESGGASWPGDYVRERFDPPQAPLLGAYSNRDPSVIREQLAWMESYGIDFLVFGGWTRWAWSSVTVVDHLLPELEGRPVKLAWLVRMARFTQDGGISPSAVDSLLAEFEWAADALFGHANYLRVAERVVVFLNASAGVSAGFEEAVGAARQAMRDRGFELFLIADDIRWDGTQGAHTDVEGFNQYQPWELNLYPGYPIASELFADLSVRAAAWDTFSRASDRVFVPTALPGFNRRLLEPPPPALPRRISPGASSTSTLAEFIKTMRPFVDPELRMMLINSWNRWQFDTQIEPVAPAPGTSVDDSGVGRYTEGYVYEGDGFAPLAVVRALLAPEIQVSSEREQPDPGSSALLTVYPNPVGPASATVVVRLPRSETGRMDLYDALGRHLGVLHRGPLTSGTQLVDLDAGRLAAGIYFIRLRTDTPDLQATATILRR